MADIECVDGICSRKGGLEDFENFFAARPWLIALIVIYFLCWYFPGWYVVFQYSNRITESRPDSMPRQNDSELLQRIEATPILDLVADFPTTFAHFVCCYSLRAADTFAAARLTSFWAAYWSMLCVAPILCCYIPLMRSSLREQLGGDTWDPSDCLICMCPWTHYALCFGFREAVIVDIASEVTIQWPCDSMVGFVMKKPIMRLPTPIQKPEQIFHTKIAADFNTVGDPIKVASMTSPKPWRPPRKKKDMECTVDVIDLCRTTQIVEKKPISRPQCVTFLETGKCQLGESCYWSHGSNPDHVQRLDCPKKHGVRKLPVEHRMQCSSCQNLIFVGDIAYMCRPCHFCMCLICARSFVDIARPEEVD